MTNLTTIANTLAPAAPRPPQAASTRRGSRYTWGSSPNPPGCTGKIGKSSPGKQTHAQERWTARYKEMKQFKQVSGYIVLHSIYRIICIYVPRSYLMFDMSLCITEFRPL